MSFERLVAVGLVSLFASWYVIRTLHSIWRDLRGEDDDWRPASHADSPSAAALELLTGHAEPASASTPIKVVDNPPDSHARVDFYDNLTKVLSTALQADPTRLDLRFKLLEVLHFLRRERDFRQQLQLYRAHGGSGSGDRWTAIADMQASFAPVRVVAPVAAGTLPEPSKAYWSTVPSSRRFHEGHDQHRAGRASEQLAEDYRRLLANPAALTRFQTLTRNHLHRPTPLQWAERVGKIFKSTTLLLKREDLCSQEDVNAICAFSQVFVAAELGRREVITASSDGLSAVPVARAAAALGLQCRVYLDRRIDPGREPSLQPLRAFGARLLPAPGQTFDSRDPRRSAYAAWLEEAATTLFVCGAEGGPTTHQKMLMDFHGLIGLEIQSQCAALGVSDLSAVIAPRTAGLSAFGVMNSYLRDSRVRKFMHHAPDARDRYQREHNWLRDSGLVEYRSIAEDTAIEAQIALARVEGIAVNTEDAGALAIALQLALKAETPSTMVVLLSPQCDSPAAVALGSGQQMAATPQYTQRAA